MVAQHVNVPGRALLGWWTVCAAATLAFNDFVLKVCCPSWLSGKLSDLAINFLLPIMVASTFEWTLFVVARLRKKPWVQAPAWFIWVSCLIAGGYFAALEISPDFIHFHLSALRRIHPMRLQEVTRDVSDLGTLVMVLPAAYVLQRHRRPPAGRPESKS